MTDIAIIYKDGFFDFDFDQNAADFNLDEGLDTAVIVSVFIDGRADVEQLPFGEIDQRGFWADTYPQVEGEKSGSLLWTLQREKSLNSVVEKGKSYVRDSLRWMIRDGIASRIEVDGFIGSFSVQDKSLVIIVKIRRPKGDETFKFDIFWESYVVKISRVN